MKKSNSKSKAQSAFWNLGAVVLITATIFFVACNQTGGGGGKPTPKPKHAITFDVEGENGTLKAKADGVAETNTSPISVEEGKTVTFTAKANDGYRVKGWTLDGSAVNGTNTEYKLKVTKPAIVKVSFEAIPPTKYTVTLNQTEGGTVTSSPAIPQDGKVDENTVITFTATANEGYKIGKWKVTPAEALQAGTGADGSETAKVKITADTTVSVSFEPNPVEGGAVLILSPDKLTIEVRAVTEDGSAITVEGCNETTLASGTRTTLLAKGTKVILKGNITGLSCSDNQLTSLNVQGLTALQKLFCGGNKLTELNVQGLTALQELWCSGNQLPELNVQGLTALQKLECRDNQLTELNVQGLTALQKLECWKNQLTELNVQGCAALQKLGCYSNQLNAQTMTEILNALPTRTAGDDARAILYTEETDKPEGNYKDFTQPAELKAALDGAKKRNWKLGKINESGIWKDI